MLPAPAPASGPSPPDGGRGSNQADQGWFEIAHRLREDVALVPLVEDKFAFAHSQRVRRCTWAVVGINCDYAALCLADAGGSPR